MKAYQHTGDCPRCGAPIFSVQPCDDETGEPLVYEPPSAHYTCDCRAYMPGGIAGMGDGDPDETVDVADRKTMARRRAAEEPESVERAD